MLTFQERVDDGYHSICNRLMTQLNEGFLKRYGVRACPAAWVDLPCHITLNNCLKVVIERENIR